MPRMVIHRVMLSCAARRSFLLRYRSGPRRSPTGAAAGRSPRRREERAARRVRRPRKPSAEKLFLLLPAFAVRLGARFTLGRVLRLRAHLVAHAIAVRVALLAGAGLFGLAVRRLH